LCWERNNNPAKTYIFFKYENKDFACLVCFALFESGKLLLEHMWRTHTARDCFIVGVCRAFAARVARGQQTLQGDIIKKYAGDAVRNSRSCVSRVSSGAAAQQKFVDFETAAGVADIYSACLDKMFRKGPITPVWQNGSVVPRVHWELPCSWVQLRVEDHYFQRWKGPCNDALKHSTFVARRSLLTSLPQYKLESSRREHMRCAWQYSCSKVPDQLMNVITDKNLASLASQMLHDLEMTKQNMGLFYLAAYEPAHWWVVNGKPMYLASWLITDNPKFYQTNSFAALQFGEEESSKVGFNCGKNYLKQVAAACLIALEYAPDRDGVPDRQRNSVPYRYETVNMLH